MDIGKNGCGRKRNKSESKYETTGKKSMSVLWRSVRRQKNLITNKGKVDIEKEGAKVAWDRMKRMMLQCYRSVWR